MEPKNEDLEDEFPFQTGDCQVPAVHFAGCSSVQLSILIASFCIGSVCKWFPANRSCWSDWISSLLSEMKDFPQIPEDRNADQ